MATDENVKTEELYVLYRGGGGRGYQIARVEKKTAQLYKLNNSTGYDRQIYHKEAVLELTNGEFARSLYKALDAICDEREAEIGLVRERAEARMHELVEDARRRCAQTRGG